jgi:hypothetical protein
MRTLILIPVGTQAADSVAITRNPGFPSPGDNAVATTLTIAREMDTSPEQATATEAFFTSVRKALAKGRVPNACCRRDFDAPFTEIDISLDGKTYALIMTSRGTGLKMPIDPSREERRVADVMERIVSLSDEWEKASSR